MTIKRVNHGRHHTYVDLDTGQKIPGVTSITKHLPKDALVDWAANTTVDYAIDHWARLTELSISARAKELRGARYTDRDTAANRGTQVHKLAEQLVHGDRVAVPDDLAGHVKSYIAFLDEFDVIAFHVETVVVSHAHGYCGTLDLIADLLDPDDPEPDPQLRARQRWLLDIKTSRSGVFGESVLQLAGYRFADACIDGDGEEQDMPDVDRCGVVHVRADGYDLIPVEISETEHRRLLYAREIGRFGEEYRALIGEPLVSPQTSTYRLTRE